MKKVIGILILALVFVGCGASKNLNSNSNIDFVELAYGICSVNIEQAQSMENSPSGIHYISSDFNLLQRTDKIPAKQGQRFGVAYLLKSPEYKEVQVEVVWTFPEPVKSINGRIYKEVRYLDTHSTNEDFHETYALNSEYPIVKGDWKFELFVNGDKLYERNFELL